MSDKSPKALVKDRAKELAGQGGDDAIVTLSTGVLVRLHAVSSALVEDVKRAIPEPQVPRVYIQEKEREEENPNDPTYIAEMDRVQKLRGEAVLDALILFGIELLEGMPEDDKWLRKLQMLERRGLMDFDGFSLDDPFDREFLYKRYVAVAGADMRTIAPLYGVRPQEVAAARQTFLGDEARLRRVRVPAETRDEDGSGDERPDDGVGSGDGSES